MLLIREILVSDDLVEEQFLCNLEACHGACCWEGDWGAPLDTEELKTLEDVYEEVRPFLSEEGVKVIEKEGKYVYYRDAEDHGTPLLANGACAYMTRDEKGIAQCGIERAWKAGATSFRKPISCHLYPVRVTKADANSMEALNYDRWDICSAACSLGKKHSLPVYQFAREAIIRKYGEEFYEELDAAGKVV